MNNIQFKTLTQRHALFLIHNTLIKSQAKIRQNANIFIKNHLKTTNESDCADNSFDHFRFKTIEHLNEMRQQLKLAHSMRIASIKEQLKTQKKLPQHLVSLLFAPVVGMQLKENTISCLIELIQNSLPTLTIEIKQMFSLQKELQSLVNNTPLFIQNDKNDNLDPMESFIELCFLSLYFTEHPIDNIALFYPNKINHNLSKTDQIISIIQRSQFLSINIISNEQFLNSDFINSSITNTNDVQTDENVNSKIISADNPYLLLVQIWLLNLYKSIQKQHPELFLSELVQAQAAILSKIKASNNDFQTTSNTFELLYEKSYINFLQTNPFNALMLPQKNNIQ